jgi:hypothetical protein
MILTGEEIDMSEPWGKAGNVPVPYVLSLKAHQELDNPKVTYTESEK